MHGRCKRCQRLTMMAVFFWKCQEKEHVGVKGPPLSSLWTPVVQQVDKIAEVATGTAAQRVNYADDVIERLKLIGLFCVPVIQTDRCEVVRTDTRRTVSWRLIKLTTMPDIWQLSSGQKRKKSKNFFWILKTMGEKDAINKSDFRVTFLFFYLQKQR